MSFSSFLKWQEIPLNLFLLAIKIAESNHIHSDAWELGSGINYSVNQLYSFFNEKYNVKSVFVPDQPGNYRKTLRINDDALKLLNWRPKDRLKSHIDNLNL